MSDDEAAQINVLSMEKHRRRQALDAADLIATLRAEADLLDAHTASFLVHLPPLLRRAADALEYRR